VIWLVVEGAVRGNTIVKGCSGRREKKSVGNAREKKIGERKSSFATSLGLGTTSFESKRKEEAGKGGGGGKTLWGSLI